MASLKKRSHLSTLIFFSLLASGCGEEPVEEVVAFESAPQVTITLHSQLELDFSLDPDPQLQTADTDELEEGDNKFIAGVYAKLKMSASLRSQLGGFLSLKRIPNISLSKGMRLLILNVMLLRSKSVRKSQG